ncbi:MAG: sce7726 family protein [Aequorivita sp.]
MFRNIVRKGDFVLFEKQTSKYLNTTGNDTNLDIIKTIYKALNKEYRCEYIYKNNLLLHIIKTYGLKKSLTFNELRIGASLADLVMLNGKVKIYEIKTELDNLEKLEKQIIDYKKFADEVYIVTDDKYAKKLLIKYNDTDIGIIILNSKNKLEVVKKAEISDLSFDFETIFKILRKQEYLDLVSDNFGYIPNVPNTKVFSTCYNLLSKIDIKDFQKQVLGKLKERKLKSPNLLKSKKTPVELKHICNSLDFNDSEYQKLYNFLETKNLCTNRI